MHDPELDRFVPEVEALNDELRKRPPLSRQFRRGPAGIHEVRQNQDQQLAERVDAPGPDRVLDVGVPVRVFESERPAAVYVSMHGGGWVSGSAAMDDVDSARIAKACNVTVLSVDYRLVPEVLWTVVLQDCLEAVRYAVVDGSRELGTDTVVVGGTSAGATLAVHALLRLRDDPAVSLDRVAGATLAYGVYDFGRTPSQRSWNQNLVLDPEYIPVTRSLIFPGLDDEDRRDPEISPLYADLAGLPPAFFSVGALDPFLDDSLFMAQRWRAAGNEAVLRAYPAAPHSFSRHPTGMAAAHHRDTEEFVTGVIAARSSTMRGAEQ